MGFEIPPWLQTLPEHERASARTRFLIRLAALYATKDGNLSDLSRLAGLAENSLATLSKGRENISPELAVKLEKVLGRKLFPRELFRPDLFVAGED